jgi:hypothetical protein
LGVEEEVWVFWSVMYLKKTEKKRVFEEVEFSALILFSRPRGDTSGYPTEFVLVLCKLVNDIARTRKSAQFFLRDNWEFAYNFT